MKEEFTNKFSEKMKESLSKTTKFNNGLCKETCNCIEIAESKNGGDMVKNYPCLGNDTSKLSDDFKPMNELEEKAFNIIGLYKPNVSKDLEITRETKLVLLKDAQTYADEQIEDFQKWLHKNNWRISCIEHGIVYYYNPSPKLKKPFNTASHSELLEQWKQQK